MASRQAGQLNKYPSFEGLPRAGSKGGERGGCRETQTLQVIFQNMHSGFVVSERNHGTFYKVKVSLTKPNSCTCGEQFGQREPRTSCKHIDAFLIARIRRNNPEGK